MHRLFFAIFPERAALDAVARVAEDLKTAKVLRGRWMEVAKYHITARFLGDHPDPVEETIERARAAAARVRSAPFEIALDRIATFRGRYQSPCVLRCTAQSDAAMQALWRGLGSASSAVRAAEERPERRFLPHLTIAYGDRMLDDPIGIEPIVSRIEEFALVDSHQSQHRILERWPLRA